MNYQTTDSACNGMPKGYEGGGGGVKRRDTGGDGELIVIEVEGR